VLVCCDERLCACKAELLWGALFAVELGLLGRALFACKAGVAVRGAGGLDMAGLPCCSVLNSVLAGVTLG